MNVFCLSQGPALVKEEIADNFQTVRKPSEMGLNFEHHRTAGLTAKGQGGPAREGYPTARPG